MPFKIFDVNFTQSNETGKIILDSQMYLKDEDGYYFTGNQKNGIIFLLEGLIKTIKNDDLESLK